MAQTKVTQNELADDTVGAWATWSPTVSGFSSNPSGVYRWKQIGKTVFIAGTQTTNGTSNSTDFSLTLPVTAATITNMRWVAVCPIVNNGTSAQGRADIASGGTTVIFYRDPDGNTFASSGNKRVLGFEMTYEAA